MSQVPSVSESALLARAKEIPQSESAPDIPAALSVEDIRAGVLAALKEAQKESRRYFWDCVKLAIFWWVALSILVSLVAYIVQLPR